MCHPQPVRFVNARDPLAHALAHILDHSLNLGGRIDSFDESTPLRETIPELDSIGVVAIIAACEERFGISVEDDEIDSSAFRTFGSLLSLMRSKIEA